MHGLLAQSSQSQRFSDLGTNANGTTIASAPPYFARPTTPVRSAKKPGLSHQSPTNGGVEMETTEDIDYSLDAYKDFKPTCSYSCMIGRAILSTRDESMTLAGIYKWISNNFAFYRHNKTNWKVCHGIFIPCSIGNHCLLNVELYPPQSLHPRPVPEDPSEKR